MDTIYDLLYCGEHETEIQKMVKDEYPQARITDTSDFIHSGRFSVELAIKRNDWMLWLMRNGIHEMSFDWNIMRMDNPNSLKPLIKRVVEEQRNSTS